VKMTEEQREKVRRLRSEGMTLVEVARRLGTSEAGADPSIRAAANIVACQSPMIRFGR
jgi:transcriptional regulator